MVVALRILIVLILLFGAAAVKGWIKSAAVGILGFVAICAVLIWLGSFFGENGVMYVLFGLSGGMVLLGIIAAFIGNETPEEEQKRRAYLARKRKRQQAYRQRQDP